MERKKFKVVCVNDKNKPSDFPEGCWIEKDELYTVVCVNMMANQGNRFSFVLEEIKFPEGSPYDSFFCERFRPASEDDLEAERLVKELLLEVGSDSLLELV